VCRTLIGWGMEYKTILEPSDILLEHSSPDVLEGMARRTKILLERPAELWKVGDTILPYNGCLDAVDSTTFNYSDLHPSACNIASLPRNELKNLKLIRVATLHEPYSVYRNYYTVLDVFINASMSNKLRFPTDYSEVPQYVFSRTIGLSDGIMAEYNSKLSGLQMCFSRVKLDGRKAHLKSR